MKAYKRPDMDIVAFEGEDILNTSNGGLTARFNRIAEDNQTNAIQLDSLHS